MHSSSLRAPIETDMTAVDAVIRTRLASEVALVGQIAEYIISAGGKRLRPVLLLLVAGACGYNGPKAQELAAVIELIHTATLLHDDVVDESGMRRGRKTANALFGNAASVLVGDFLYSRSFQMMVAGGRMDVMAVLSEATNVIAEGEVLQLMHIGDSDVTEEQYLRVIRYKTAKLFEAAGRLGAMAAGAEHQVTPMAEFGMRLGTAFQLTDDVLDYAGVSAETGKAVGGDFAEGKPTLPLIHVLTHGSAAQCDVVRQAIARPGEASFSSVLAAIESTGALDYTHRLAVAEADAARALLGGLPASDYRQSLLQLCSSAVERKA